MQALNKQQVLNIIFSISILIAIVFMISELSLLGSKINNLEYRYSNISLDESKKSISVNHLAIEEVSKSLEILDRRFTDFERSNTQLNTTSSNNYNRLVKANNAILESVMSCKLFVYNYFLFFEKANELFANGTTGCAEKYILSNEPKKFPKGCFRYNVGKSNNKWDHIPWYQNPDKKYFNSLKKYYNEYKKYELGCVKNIEKL